VQRPGQAQLDRLPHELVFQLVTTAAAGARAADAQMESELLLYFFV
jgi:hypothetical protein